MLTHGTAQPPAHFQKQFIAHVVAQGVVDVLEMVNTNHHHGQRFTRTLRHGDGTVSAILQQGSVGQTGEDIKMG